jgi:hypothetical protein
MTQANVPFLPEMEVDHDWYISRNGIVRPAILRDPALNLTTHFQQEGQMLWADPIPLFWLSHTAMESVHRASHPL